MSKKRHYARMVQARLATVVCPNCLHKLEGVTAIALDHEFERVGQTRKISIKDHPTKCVYCWALLVFADEEGHLRLMTKEERDRYKLHPVLAKAIEHMKPKPPDFTRKNFN